MSVSSSSSNYAGSASSSVESASTSLATSLATSLLESLSTEKLDRCIAIQSQASGKLHAQSSSLEYLKDSVAKELHALKYDFSQGSKIAATLTANLHDLQKRIKAIQDLVSAKSPAEWEATRHRFLEDDEDS